MQTLMVAAEHGTTGVWLDGAPVDDITEIGASSALNKAFDEWSSRFTYLAMNTSDDSIDPRWKEFDERGRVLAKMLKAEIKERYTVTYSFYAENSDWPTNEVIS